MFIRHVYHILGGNRIQNDEMIGNTNNLYNFHLQEFRSIIEKEPYSQILGGECVAYLTFNAIIITIIIIVIVTLIIHSPCHHTGFRYINDNVLVSDTE